MKHVAILINIVVLGIFVGFMGNVYLFFFLLVFNGWI